MKLPQVKSTAIPPTYGSPEKTPLRFEVKAGPQAIDIPLNGKTQTKQ